MEYPRRGPHTRPSLRDHLGVPPPRGSADIPVAGPHEERTGSDDAPYPDTVEQSTPHPATPEQIELPFLTPERAATIGAARVAVQRAMTFANGNRRPWEADELARLGEQLVKMLEDNATAYRATTR